MKMRLILTVMMAAMCAQAGRDITPFNDGWKFARFGAMPDGSQLAELPGLEKGTADDSGWRVLNLPHDWGIEGPFCAELPNRTGKLPWVGIGWYRKSFQSLTSDQDKRIFIDFDGSMSNTKVWVNGAYVGEWPYGYTSFRLELTDHIKPGELNTIAVRLDNKAESSRWYPGGGIYRNVRLVKLEPIHVAHWGVFVSTPVVSESQATIDIKTEVDGEASGVKVVHEILDPITRAVVGKGAGTSCLVELTSPKLWDLKSPNLYRLKTTLHHAGKVVDTVETSFGIRRIEFDAERGAILNGKKIRINGVCQHHDLGPLGAAINTRALERQIKILQSMGCNAIRTSHNPPAPELLDLCDRMGMLVQVEAFDTWTKSKTENDYAQYFEAWHKRDLTSMVRRDRNHPSVIMWSTGNEIPDMKQSAGAVLSQKLTDIVRAADPTRLVTAGCNSPKSGFNGVQKTLDLFGYNYKPHMYKRFHAKNPDQPLYGSETASTVSSRGEYFFPVSDDQSKGSGGRFHVSSYDLTAPPWANNPDVEFAAQDKSPWVFGEFVWTGFDYIGEPTPYNKDTTNLLNFTDEEERKRMEEELKKIGGNIPPRSSYFGIVDLCGFPKDRFYLYQSRWRPERPMAHILPHWNWPDRIGKITPVHVYTSGDEAELFLNGTSLGRKKKGEYEYRLRWDEVVYKPGTLKVVAYKNGTVWAQNIMKTTGAAAQVQLTADRTTVEADGVDLSFITVQVSDKAGLLVPRSNHPIHFSLSGPGEIIAVGNGDPTSHESFQSLERKVFNGLGLVVIRTQKDQIGSLILKAESDGLQGAEVRILSTRSTTEAHSTPVTLP